MVRGLGGRAVTVRHEEFFCGPWLGDEGMAAARKGGAGPTSTLQALRMSHSLLFDRRQWLKSSAVVAAGLALGGKSRLQAQHETERFSATLGVARISGNENPYGPSQGAIMAMLQSADSACRYAFAESHGSSEVLDDYATYLSRSGPGEVVTATPGYLKFTHAMAAAGSTIIAVPTTKAMVHDLAAMAAKIGPATKCVYICNPNNPTGTIVPAAELRSAVIEMAKQCPVLVDEAYLEFSDNFAGNTMAPLVAEGHNVIVARTFSKLYGMAGMRLGYGLMAPPVAAEVGKISPNFLGLLSVNAALASLADDGYAADIRRKVKAERDRLCATLVELGRAYAEPQGNFVFLHTGMPVTMFQKKMAGENVEVGRAFPPALDWCRISIGLPEEMNLCHAALKKIFAA